MNKPVKKFRIGFCECAIWEGESNFYSVTFSRSYKNDEGEIKNSASFGHQDLLNVGQLAIKAEEWISAQ